MDSVFTSSTFSEKQASWRDAAQAVSSRIAPLWPLKHFVAVNPFLEMVDQPFSEVALQMGRLVPGGMLIEKEFYQAKWQSGVISDTELEQALAEFISRGALGRELDVPTLAELKDWLSCPESAAPEIATIAKAVDELHGSRWEHEVVDEISHWLGAYLDQGQALWSMPWKEVSLFQAWREAASIDRNPEMLGLSAFRSFVAQLPSNPLPALVALLEQAEIKVENVEDWLYRSLLSVGGWAAAVQYQNRTGASESTPLDILVIRLTFDIALLKQYDSEALRMLWREQVLERDVQSERAFICHLLWHEAFELTYKQGVLSALPSSRKADHMPPERPFAQMAFCIDVRSEPMRRAIESSHAGIHTFGYAGFFGMPIEKVPFGKASGAPHCPGIIVTPPYRVLEGAENEGVMLQQVKHKRGLASVWKGFKDSAVSCFSFVEAAGLQYAWTLTKNSFLHQKSLFSEPQFSPVLLESAGRASGTGISDAEQVTLAQGVVKALNLDVKAGRLVVLCGHGASTTNNPYDSGLQCGACGGHSGDFNALLAVEILNRDKVRSALREAHCGIPDDTVFMAGRHDTTRDEISLFRQSGLPKTHQADLAELKEALTRSDRLARVNRAEKLGLGAELGERIHKEIFTRAQDWSQVRPEWGLAGNASFIIAPRERTVDLDLGGRAFLHHYEATLDEQGELLTGILGGPMVVGSWINLQYYASAANHAVYGSGHKTLHNVNGTHGVQLGNGGDLKTGLPFQSIHDGERWVHEPVRLHVFVDAPVDKVMAAAGGNASVVNLVNNRWIHLLVADGEGGWCAITELS